MLLNRERARYSNEQYSNEQRKKNGLITFESPLSAEHLKHDCG